jgi:hypothetical protein
MANRNYYPWKATDTLWTVAARFLASTGYTNPVTLAEAIRGANATVLDWAHVPAGTMIYLPIITYQ